ncbi:MAG TPA: type 1 glutamine amidotransferase [Streptosporangiaceae bacterium]
MATRALVLVHDPAADRRGRIPGALIPALSNRDIKHDVMSFVAGSETEPDLDHYDLLVVMGSKESAYDDEIPWLARELAFVGSAVQRGLPVLGICFGGQLLARHLGGTVQPAVRGEFGFTAVDSDDPELVPQGPWMQFHTDTFVPPAGTEIARNAVGSQAFASGKVLGVQFHPEVTVDSFDSWFERWVTEDDMPTGASGTDINDLRSALARHESESMLLCDRLVGAFCARS